MKSRTALSPKQLRYPEEDARPHILLTIACITPAPAPPEVGVQREGGMSQGPEGVGVEWGERLGRLRFHTLSL